MPGFVPDIRVLNFPSTSKDADATTSLSERLDEALDHALQLGRGIVRKIAAVTNGVEDLDVLAPQRRQQPVFERPHLVERKRVEIAVGAGPDHADLLFHLQRRELRLLEKFGQARAAVEQALGRGVEAGAEL